MEPVAGTRRRFERGTSEATAAVYHAESDGSESARLSAGREVVRADRGRTDRAAVGQDGVVHRTVCFDLLAAFGTAELICFHWVSSWVVRPVVRRFRDDDSPDVRACVVVTVGDHPARRCGRFSFLRTLAYRFSMCLLGRRFVDRAELTARPATGDGAIATYSSSRSTTTWDGMATDDASRSRRSEETHRVRVPASGGLRRW